MRNWSMAARFELWTAALVNSFPGSVGKRYQICLVVLAVALLPSAGQAQLAIQGKYSGGGTELDVATFTGKDGGRVGLIGIAAAKRVSIAFGDKSEWDSLLALWRKAKATQSATWKFVGTFKETGTKEQTLLTVAAGPGVQFTITDPKGTFSHTIPQNSFAGFETNIRQVSDFLARK